MVSNQIESRILKSNRGAFFFAEDFVNLGTSENIRQKLSRLVKEGVLDRIAPGIYLKSKKDPILGIIHPNLDQIAREIAKRNKARIAPTGVMALYLLGLTTQIPLKIVYLTDGSPRQIKIGSRAIKFKNAAPKNFAIKDEVLQLVVQAFKEVGHKELNAVFLERIKPAVAKMDKNVLDSQLRYAAVWIRKEIDKLFKEIHHVD